MTLQGYLNMEQLTKTLMDLLEYYRTAREIGVPTLNSPEFKWVWVRVLSVDCRQCGQ